MSIDDHPWGDRGFAVQDPNGVILYIYSDRDPSDEFKQYHKTKQERQLVEASCRLTTGCSGRRSAPPLNREVRQSTSK